MYENQLYTFFHLYYCLLYHVCNKELESILKIQKLVCKNVDRGNYLLSYKEFKLDEARRIYKI